LPESTLGQGDFNKQNYDEFTQESARRLELLGTIELTLIKSTFAVNGGGLIALLTFLGNAEKVAEPRAAFWALAWLAAGLTLSLLSAVFSYFSNRAFHLASVADAWQAQADFHEIEEEYDSSADARWGDRFEIAFAIATALSIGLFVAGIFVGLDAIT
jgi:hypothetical protein